MNTQDALSPAPHDPWYVIWSEARAEKKVAERLASHGYDVWLPTVTGKHRWSDRWKIFTRPLFTGCLFAGTRGAGYVPLLKTAGVLTLVKEGARPAVLTSGYVADLRRIVEHPELAVEPVESQEAFVPGDEVMVREGPLAGFRGQVTERKGARRLAVWIPSIGRGAPLHARRCRCDSGDGGRSVTFGNSNVHESLRRLAEGPVANQPLFLNDDFGTKLGTSNCEMWVFVACGLMRLEHVERSRNRLAHHYSPTPSGMS